MSAVLGYVSLLICGFVALSVRMCIAWANEVEGTKSLCLRNNEILASKHDIAALKVKQAILVFDNFVAFYSGLRCLEAQHLNIFMFQTPSTVMQLFKGSYFSVAAGSRHVHL